ncbi:hypothetical protein BH09VER1_BH09VER1_27750 [soil metagenome]
MFSRSSSPGRTVSDRRAKPAISQGREAFTLVEVLVGCAVLFLLLVMLFSVMSQTTKTVRRASAQLDAFQTARTAFDTISQKLSAATMNTYWDYYDATNGKRTTNNATTFQPARYGRASDLQFLVQTNGAYGQSLFFAVPESVSADATKDQTQGLLNGLGYYVQFGSDDNYRPSALIGQKRYRYRLMQALQPTEGFQAFYNTNWTDSLTNYAWPLADNVIALIVWPRRSIVEDPAGTNISPNYIYDSRTNLPASASSTPSIQYAQMPPTVQLTLVVIDEPSAVRQTPDANEPTAIKTALAGKFTDVTQYQNDLNKLQTALTAAHINYRTLNSTVTLRESKWSAQ